MISSEWVYWLIGFLFIAFGVLVFRDTPGPKRTGSAAFWIILGACFLYGTFVTNGTAPAWILGVAVLVLTALVGTKSLASDPGIGPNQSEQHERANKYGNKLFIPALLIPLITVLFSTFGGSITIGGKALFAAGSQTLTGLAIASLIAVCVGCALFAVRNPMTPVREGKRLAVAIGWAIVLPQMLATLGTLFEKAGVGTAMGTVISHIVPQGSLLAAVIVYCVGMALFTIVMGNAFAAFPIMTAAIGYPVLVLEFQGTAAAVFAIGMLAGFCGTLLTPMAANFNLVPAALLDTKSRYEVIRAQAPTAVLLLIVNIVLMRTLCF